MKIYNLPKTDTILFKDKKQRYDCCIHTSFALSSVAKILILAQLCIVSANKDELPRGSFTEAHKRH